MPRLTPDQRAEVDRQVARLTERTRRNFARDFSTLCAAVDSLAARNRRLAHENAVLQLALAEREHIRKYITWFRTPGGHHADHN
jgi:hypothetical protein